MLTEFYEFKKYKIQEIFLAYIKRIYELWKLKKQSVLVIEKELFPFLPFWVEKLFLRNKVVILDYDDAIFHQYDQHRNIFIQRFLGKKIDKLLNLADCVVCGSHYIFERAERAKAKSIYLLPTVVDTDNYQVRKSSINNVPIIVWIGTPATVHYLKIIERALQELTLTKKFIFRIIGVKNYTIPNVDVECIPWSTSNEVLGLASADIGIMPLFETDWEKGKCGYKLIQYMASGLAVVCSAVGENIYIVNHNCGFNVSQHNEWVSYLSFLIDEPIKRKEMGLAGRMRVENFYSTKKIADQWVSIFRRIKNI